MELASFLFGVSVVFPVVLNRGFTSIACLGNEKDGFSMLYDIPSESAFHVLTTPLIVGKSRILFSRRDWRGCTSQLCILAAVCRIYVIRRGSFSHNFAIHDVLTLCIDWISGIIWIHLIPIPA
jgi:hypothetical protein